MGILEPKSGQRLAILGGVRTPFLKVGTGFRRTSAADLARAAFVEALARTECDPAALDEVILGCAGQPHDTQNLARVAAVRAGVPDGVPALTVHRNCASGMEALTQAHLRMRAGAGELFLVGGVEAMSRSPLLFSEPAAEWFGALARARTPWARVRALLRVRLRHFKPRIALVEALTDPLCGMLMGETAEVLAREWGIGRKAQDAYALESQRRTAAAQAGHRFEQEIVPFFGAAGATGSIDADNGVRPDLTLEQLARLPPVFERRFGTVTVGNSCQITDGAVALVVASERKADALKVRPLGWLSAAAYVGLEPARMGLGPVHATARLLEATGGSLAGFDLIEINEAFAVQVLACLEAFASSGFARSQLGRTEAIGVVDPARLNVNGGAIALGHPAGATGLRLVLTALVELRRRSGRRALATLCVGGGQGAALALEAA